MNTSKPIRVGVIGASADNGGEGEAIGLGGGAEQAGEERECVGELSGSGVGAYEGIVEDSGLSGLGLVEEGAG